MKRFLSFCVAVVLLLTMIPVITAPTAEAASTDNRGFITLDEEDSTIAPGVTQTIGRVRKKYNSQQMVYYLMTIDTSDETTQIHVNYKDNDWEAYKNGQYGLQEVTKQMDAAQARHTDQENFTIVGGINGTGYNMNTGDSSTYTLMMEGHELNVASDANQGFFGVRESGKAMIGWSVEEYKQARDDPDDPLVEALGDFGSVLIKNNTIVNSDWGGSTPDCNARTAVGVTEDGDAIFLVVDGKQLPFSEGCDMYELALILKEAGCVNAFNWDGGGSTTFVSRPEGESTYRVINRPCDGAPRAVATSLYVVSTAPASDEFQRASIDADAEYITPGGTVNLTAAGISPAGTPVEIPDDVEWSYKGEAGQLTGSGKTATFVANQNQSGDDTEVVISMMKDGEPVGTFTFHVVKPNVLNFTQESYMIPYDESMPFEVYAAYSDNDSEHEVTLHDGDVTFTLDPAEGLGSIDKNVFTSRAMDEGSVDNGTVTATLTCNNNRTATATIKLGRGSEVAINFEDTTMQTTFSITRTDNVAITAEIVDRENGMVHNGNHSLKITIDYRYLRRPSTEAGVIGQLFFKPEPLNSLEFPDALSFGAWVWVPDESILSWFSFYSDDGGHSVIPISDGKNYSEGHWEYFKAPRPSDSKFTWFSFALQGQTGSNPMVYNENNKLVLYIDDVSLDYSPVVPDRGLPVFEDVTTFATSDDLGVLEKGKVYEVESGETVIFQANVSDFEEAAATGIASVEAYIDGVSIGATYTNGKIVTEEAKLAAGVHTLKLYAVDGAGNRSNETRQFKITANSDMPTVTLADSTKNRLENFNGLVPINGVYYADVIASDISAVQSISMDLDLCNVQTWKLDHADVDPKFEMKWEQKTAYDIDENIVTVTLTRKIPYAEGDSNVIATLPIKIWGDNGAAYMPEGATYTWSPEDVWANSFLFPMDVSIDVDRGVLTCADGSEVTFSGERLQKITELNNYPAELKAADTNKTHWHLHSNAVAIDDIEPTCTTKGLKNRRECPVCHSPVSEEDWGEILDVIPHTYEENEEGKLACTMCEELFNGVHTDGKTYKDGVVLDGWQSDDTYYVDGEKNTGVQQVEDLWYDFGEDGVCEGQKPITGFFVYDDVTYYAEAGVKWVPTDGDANSDWFFIGEDGYHVSADGRVHNVADDDSVTPIEFVDNRKCLVSGYKIYTCPECGDEHSSELLWYEGHKWRDAEHGDYVCTVCGTQGIDIAKCKVEFAGKYFTYTGGNLLAKHTLTYTDEQGNTRTLWCESDRDGRDGLSTYTNNVNVGMATLKVEGRGDFYGEIYAQFEIVPASVETLTAVQKDHGSVELTWTPALGAEYYSVWYRPNEQGDWQELAHRVEGTSYTVEGLEMGERYAYRVASRTDVDGRTFYCTNWSNTAAGVIEHIWVEDTEKSSPATCTEAGLSVRNCEVCGLHEEQELPALGHKVEEWTTTVEPTTSAEGERQGECTVCGETVTETLAKLPPVNTGSGGSTAPGNKQETTTNPDGSTTTTTTKPDGSKTETTTQTDGTVTEKVTAKDGSSTETTKKTDGTVTEKVTQTDGSATERTTTPEGVTGKVDTDSKGEVTSAEVVIPQKAAEQNVVTAPVEIPAVKNAADAPEISVKTDSADSTKVEIPVTEFGPGTVAVVVHPDGTEEIVRDCVIGENGVVLNVEGDVTLKIVDNTQTFADVEPVDHWAAGAVEFVAARQLFNGTDVNEFTPDGDMKRGMLVTVLYRLTYEPEAGDAAFTDVDSGAYYADAVAWAESNGIVNGYGGNEFRPDEDVTREQIVTILYRYAEKNGYLTERDGNLEGFADAGSVSSYASDAMSWAVGTGLIGGVDATHLAPTSNATRAEVATILMRFVENLIY